MTEAAKTLLWLATLGAVVILAGKIMDGVKTTTIRNI